MSLVHDILCTGAMLGIGTALVAADPVNAPASRSQTTLVPPSAAAPLGSQYWFGVAVENIPPAFARQLKLKPDQGLMIFQVQPNSPAQKVGLKAEDVLIELNGQVLSNQEELARAANLVAATRSGGSVDGAGLVPEKARLTLLRSGDRMTVEVTPGPRPANMLVAGGGQGNFTLHSMATPTALPPQMPTRNYVLPNGMAAQVGPGYLVDLQIADPSSGPAAAGSADGVTARSIKAIVDRGQTVILSQETDGNGVSKNTIGYSGAKMYPVEAGRIDEVPVELRPLAQELLANTTLPARNASTPANAAPLEDRMNNLERENRDLKQQLSDLIDLLRKQQSGGGAGK